MDAACCVSLIAACALVLPEPATAQTSRSVTVVGQVAPRCWGPADMVGSDRIPRDWMPERPAADLVRCTGNAASRVIVDRVAPVRQAIGREAMRITVTPRT